MFLDKTEDTKVSRRAYAKAVVAVLLLMAFASLGKTAVAQTVSGSTDLVISQIYARGGEPGAAFAQ